MTGGWYLYAIRLPVNDYAVAYIGVSKRSHKRRFTEHCRANTPLGEAIRLCGRELVILEVLERGDREHIYQREIETIAALNTLWPSGYNLSRGGTGGRDPLPSTRAKISAAHRGKRKPPLSAEQRARMSAAQIGKKMSAEVQEKIIAAVKGKPKSAEHRAKISAALKNQPKSADHVAKVSAAKKGVPGKPMPTKTRAAILAANLGRPKSLEHRARISASSKGRKPTFLGKKHSDETRAKMSAAKMARRASQPNYTQATL